MYLPRAFAETKLEQLHDMIERHNFATWIVRSGLTLDTAHVPIVLDRGRGSFGTIRGHVALANPIWRMFDGKSESIALFHGPHGYISPSWYPDRVEVPTWNYVVVYAYGRPKPVREPDAVDSILRALVSRHEHGLGHWSLSELPPHFHAELRAEIIGFEMEVVRLEGKFKLSQNQDEATRRSIVRALERRGAPADSELAELIDQRTPST